MAKTERAHMCEEGHMIRLDIHSSDQNITNNFGLVNDKQKGGEMGPKYGRNPGATADTRGFFKKKKLHVLKNK